VIYRFRIDHMLAPGRILHHSIVSLNDSTYNWGSAPDPGGYHIGRDGYGSWRHYVHTDQSVHWILYDLVDRGGASRPAGHAMVLTITDDAIRRVSGSTGLGHVYRSAVPGFRGEVLWRLILP